MDDHSHSALNWEALRSRYLLAGHVQQLRLAEVLGSRSWDLNLATGFAAFDELETRIGLLGNVSTTAGTWRWGWALTPGAGFASGIDGASRRAAELPEAQGVAFLTDPDVALDDADPWELAMIAAGAAAGDPIYRGPHPNGALYFTVRDIELPQVSAVTTLTMIAQVLTELTVNDHRAAMDTLLQRLRWLPERSQGNETVWSRSDETATLNVEFDDLNRIVQLSTGTLA